MRLNFLLEHFVLKSFEVMIAIQVAWTQVASSVLGLGLPLPGGPSGGLVPARRAARAARAVAGERPQNELMAWNDISHTYHVPSLHPTIHLDGQIDRQTNR